MCENIEHQTSCSFLSELQRSDGASKEGYHFCFQGNHPWDCELFSKILLMSYINNMIMCFDAQIVLVVTVIPAVSEIL